MHRYRTHHCNELRADDIGKTVKISGWIQKFRDHGGVTFFDLRDHYGITQVVTSENEALKAKINSMTKETTVTVTGEVIKRFEDASNEDLDTGDIEVLLTDIEVHGKSKSQLPFEVTSSIEAREDLRFKYRFLDLRNQKVHNNIILRSKVTQSIRKKMTDLGFLEIQTPILTSSSPEGARDYLIPSRVHSGKFYALPQAPQQFKQLLMTSGFDRYFQIAPCFRDEDARADRSPGEFYQLDMEMAFATQEDVFNVIESVLFDIFTEYSNWKVEKPFIHITYEQAMLKFGTDKPDLRNPLVITDLSETFTESSFNAFKGKTVRVIHVPDCSSQPRRWFDKIVDFATTAGAKGLAWLKVCENKELVGPIAKFLSEDETSEIISKTNASVNGSLFFIADKKKDAEKLAGIIRTELANRLELIEKGVYKFCWIVDFPMYELDEESHKIVFSHNPFSMPQGGMDALLNKDPLDIKAYQYDIVCNGVELSSGAVRNHSPELMLKAFELAGYTKDIIESKFPALYNAFQYGAPPHAGVAPGLDRILMLLADEPNIREVIAFPMNSKAQDLLMNAPGEVTPQQLNDIHVNIINDDELL